MPCRMSTNWLKKMAGNVLITLEELNKDLNKWWFLNWHFIVPTDMFIEGQYLWEREEYDEHG